MSDAAQAIFNGISVSYPNIINGMCYFHMMKSMKDRHYTDEKSKGIFLSDLRSLSKSYDLNHFDSSVLLFLEKYKNHDDLNINYAKLRFEKVWLTNRNRGWHSGLLPGTVTTNNGLEVTIRIFKSNLNGNLCIVSCPKSNSDTY